MYFKWDNDKNNYLSTDEDYRILDTLTEKNEGTPVELYTKFIYRDFLKIFKRFFIFRKNTPKNYVNKKSIYEVYAMKSFDEIL